MVAIRLINKVLDLLSWNRAGRRRYLRALLGGLEANVVAIPRCAFAGVSVDH
jgi:hypothetical protein